MVHSQCDTRSVAGAVFTSQLQTQVMLPSQDKHFRNLFQILTCCVSCHLVCYACRLPAIGHEQSVKKDEFFGMQTECWLSSQMLHQQISRATNSLPGHQEVSLLCMKRRVKQARLWLRQLLRANRIAPLVWLPSGAPCLVRNVHHEYQYG